MRKGECELNEHSVAAALVACQANANWQKAQAVYDGYYTASGGGAAEAASSSSDMCFAALLDALAEGEEWELVLSYFDRRREGGGHGKRQVPMRAYERAIEACDRVDPDRSVELFYELKEAASS